MQFRGKSALKDLAYSARRMLVPWRSDPRAVVLAYHSVGNPDDPYSVTSEMFAWQLDELRRAGCTAVPLRELDRMMAEGNVPPRTVVLTFDDGRRDNYTYAFPLLKERGIPASVFLVTGSVGKRFPGTVSDTDALTLDEIREMDASGLITFGAHTVSHPKLTHVSGEDVKEEVEGSKRAVEGLLGKPCDYFAYPYGRVSESVELATRKAGFTLALSTEPGIVRPNSPRFRLPRNGIGANTTRQAFRGIIAHGSL
jgi:peptidoglycan/xylan/chitin deacetylase (PgdA/CDA1 family)